MNYKKYLKSLSSKDALVYFNESLKKHCSLKIGGTARNLIIVNNLKTLKKITKKDKNFIILGAGTNVLFKSKKYKQTIIKLSGNFKKIKQKVVGEYIFLDVGAGVNLFALNNFLRDSEISGLEWSYGIPGTVGAAIIMNAGSFGHEFGEFVSAVKVLNGDQVYWVKDFNFGYRTSSFKGKKSVILECRLKMSKGKFDEIKELQEMYFNKKKSTQPYDLNSAGSVFKHIIVNNEKIYPAKIIDSLRLKGVRIGGASISKKHAGFIVTENASASDVIKIIKFIKKKVRKTTGEVLEEEIIII